jgi:hypothetical protein
MKSATYTLALALVLSSITLAWTQRHRYSSTQTGAGRLQTRTSLFTGQTEICWPGLGWRPAETPIGTIDAEMAESAKSPKEQAAAAIAELSAESPALAALFRHQKERTPETRRAWIDAVMAEARQSSPEDDAPRDYPD